VTHSTTVDRDSRLIFDNIPGLIALLSAAGELEVVNRQLIEYFGQTLDELKYWGTNDTVHPEDLPGVVDVFSRSIAAGTPYEIVQRFKRSDGVYRWFHNRGFPIRDTDGAVIRWCVLLIDVDDQQRAEHALRESERNLKTIIDTIPGVAWSARPDGSADFLNQTYLDYTGLKAEDGMDWGWTAAVHPDDLNCLLAEWQRFTSAEESGEAEARLRRHDGEYRWFLFRSNALRDETGAVVKWYGTNIDIEDRKRAEEELRRKENFLATAQRLSLSGSFSWCLDTNEVVFSEEAYRIFGFERDSPPTLAEIDSRIHPEDRYLLPEKRNAAKATGEDQDYLIRLLMPDGSLKYLHTTSSEIQDASGRRLYIGALQDVTQRRLADEALNKARSELAHVSRVTALGALTASITHEISQPLSGIITNAGTCLRMLEAEPPDLQGARETARRTIRDGNRASDVITRLRALFSNKEFLLEPMDLNDAAREVIALSLNDLQRNQVITHTELTRDEALVTGDRIQLQQVILNLLRNASEAMVDVREHPRHLLIRTERESTGCVRLLVRDTGVGIGSQSMDRLFDSFYTTKSGGMGIGLSISRAIIERHHGRLWAETNGGPGATFAFSIPSCSKETTCASACSEPA